MSDGSGEQPVSDAEEGRTPVIVTEGLTKRFGEVVAVSDLDLTVEAGEVFGFLGPNGAGKSTTINILLGFLKPTSGRAEVLGHDVARETRAIHESIGLLPEGFEPYENLTGREHVVSAIQSKGADDDPDRILDRVGLDPDDARRPAGEYSTGMKQRMSLAVALVGEPELLVLDEPSSGLDPNGVKLLRDIVRQEAARGATVFFSSHILDEVEKVCDRVGILSDGELVAVDEIDDLRSQLGTGATVTATLDEVPPDLSLDDVADVGEVSVAGTAVSVHCERPRAKMRALRRLDELATVEDIAIEEASLEAIFDRFTNGADALGGPEADALEDATGGGEPDPTSGTADTAAAAGGDN